MLSHRRPVCDLSPGGLGRARLRECAAPHVCTLLSARSVERLGLACSLGGWSWPICVAQCRCSEVRSVGKHRPPSPSRVRERGTRRHKQASLPDAGAAHEAGAAASSARGHGLRPFGWGLRTWPHTPVASHPRTVLSRRPRSLCDGSGQRSLWSAVLLRALLSGARAGCASRNARSD